MTCDVCIVGLGTYVPERVSNADMPPLDPPMSVEDMDRIGVLQRGIAKQDESVVDMAMNAATRALIEADVAAETLDFLILSNWTERRYVPDFAPRIQHALGARRAFCFDIACACCGFLYGVSLAHGYLQNPRLQRGLVVSADHSSRHMRPGTRATLVFGDAAAAAVVQRGPGGIAIIDYELCTDGSQHHIVEVDADGYLLPHIRQKDLNVLAGRSIAQVSKVLLHRNGRSLVDVDWVIPHSGTAGVQAMIVEHLGVAREKVLTNFPDIGNVASASIPCALTHFRQTGVVEPGDLVLAAAVGLGWQYAGALLRL